MPDENVLWNVFRGFVHSFHLLCLLVGIGECPICLANLREKVNEFGQTANESVHSVVAGDDFVEESPQEDDDDVDVEELQMTNLTLINC